MTAPTTEPKEPEPRILCDCGHGVEMHEDGICYHVVKTTKRGAKILCDCCVSPVSLYREYVVSLRSSLAEAVKRAEVAEAENKAMAEKMKWIDEFVLTVERKSKGMESLLQSYREKSAEQVNT